MCDLISRTAAIDAIGKVPTYDDGMVFEALSHAQRDVALLPSAQKWIPVKTRPMDEEERSYWSDRYGFDIEYEDAVMFDCPMPKEGQEVWVCTKSGYVFQDVCDNENGMIGLEGNGDWYDIVAWMPMNRPEPYKERK